MYANNLANNSNRVNNKKTMFAYKSNILFVTTGNSMLKIHKHATSPVFTHASQLKIVTGFFYLLPL